MYIQDLHQQFSEPIISQNGVLKFDFSFDTDNSSWLDVYDNQMGINLLKEWEYSPPTMTLTIKLGNPFNRIKQITCHLSELRSKLLQMESIYDVVGE